MAKIIKRTLILIIAISCFTTNILSFITKIFNPDFKVTDIYYQIRNDKVIDKDIVLVNIGKASRGEIGKLLTKLDQYQPAVIGINATFMGNSSYSNSHEDKILYHALNNMHTKVILPSSVVNDEKNNLQLELSDKPFTQNTDHGFTHFHYDNDQNEVVRKMVKYIDLDTNRKELHFAIKLAELYNHDLASQFLSRKDSIETIFFKGNIEIYPKVEYSEILKDEDFLFNFLEGKVVLLGFIGAPHSEDLEDKFRSPLNYNSQIPDMYGVVILANIVSMILDQNYIDHLDWRATYLIGGILLIINILICLLLLNKNFKNWYYVITFIMISSELIVIFYSIIYLFSIYHIIVDFQPFVFGLVLSAYLTKNYI
ncbi:CHASE2 domain-containing protein [Flammeovirga sp. OC4]|uniref:CHASE2 domain-containing protein n=1 Tax=Flammeovirga sp. OC4 TaxID=1382345 RepID=UPI0005C6BB7E|nr:CHASE2 domain-containing protein [Flammeovirga sp. OC4]